jgi:ribonucleoside-diphosphate reductase protein NrdI
MIVVVVDSMTGLGKRFAEKLGYPVFDMDSYVQGPNHHIFLVTRSINFGDITPITKTFLIQYHHDVIAVAVGGNRSWGKNFGAAGDKINKDYGIPLIQKFEGVGFPHEVQQVKVWLTKYEQENIKN